MKKISAFRLWNIKRKLESDILKAYGDNKKDCATFLEKFGEGIRLAQNMPDCDSGYKILSDYFKRVYGEKEKILERTADAGFMYGFTYMFIVGSSGDYIRRVPDNKTRKENLTRVIDSLIRIAHFNIKSDHLAYIIFGAVATADTEEKDTTTKKDLGEMYNLLYVVMKNLGLDIFE